MMDVLCEGCYDMLWARASAAELTFKMMKNQQGL